MKTWKTCIYFQFHLILVVNVDRVYILCQSKHLKKKNLIPTYRTVSKMRMSTRSSEYPITPISEEEGLFFICVMHLP